MRIVVDVQIATERDIWTDHEWEGIIRDAVATGRYTYGGLVNDPPEGVDLDFRYIGVLWDAHALDA